LQPQPAPCEREVNDTTTYVSSSNPVPDRAFTDADLNAAIEAISNPERLREAQELVAQAAPSLEQVFAEALADGGWFDLAHERAVREAAGGQDAQERFRAVSRLLAEETRLGMLVGVAVGFELARELGRAPIAPPTKED
jgi:hypothetical protein